MKMVAASKLRRAQNNLTGARNYMNGFSHICGELRKCTDLTSYALTKKNESNNSLIVLMTGDKGLCGAFNTNVMLKAHSTVHSNREKDLGQKLLLIGKKGHIFAKKCPLEVIDSFSIEDVLKENRYRAIAHSLTQEFLNEKYSTVSIIYGHFNSAISNTPKLITLLPLEMQTEEKSETLELIEPIYEPTKEELLRSFLEQYVHDTFYFSLIHTYVSEISSRMIAMDAATNNAKDLIGKLTLDFNRKRQASITKEMLEIIGGKEALTN
jgi:F-type H+-transporting ATPase subunit gamma